MKKKIFFILFLFLILFSIGIWTGFLAKEQLANRGCFPLKENISHSFEQFKDYSEIRFIAIGDTGNSSQQQIQVSNSIKEVCAEYGCDFALLLGDNIYEKGVKNIEDAKFLTHFENIYQGLSFPFFLVLGNHDVKGNSFAQVAYSTKSERWQMPNFSYIFTAGPAKFTALNSACSPMHLFQAKQYADPESNKWSFMYAHHPIYSSGSHGDSDLFTRWYWSSFLYQNVDFYLSGHDHILEHLTHSNQDVEYIISGSGGKNSLSKDRKQQTSSVADTRFKTLDNGFVWFIVDKNKVTSIYFDGNGKKLYSFKKER